VTLPCRQPPMSIGVFGVGRSEQFTSEDLCRLQLSGTCGPDEEIGMDRRTQGGLQSANGLSLTDDRRPLLNI